MRGVWWGCALSRGKTQDVRQLRWPMNEWSSALPRRARPWAHGMSSGSGLIFRVSDGAARYGLTALQQGPLPAMLRAQIWGHVLRSQS